MLREVLSHGGHRDGHQLRVAQAELVLIGGEHADALFVHGEVFGMGLAVFLRGDDILKGMHEPGILDMPAVFLADGMLLAVEAGFYGEFRVYPGLIIIVLPVDEIGAVGFVQFLQHKLVHKGHFLAGGGKETAAQPFQDLVHAVDDAALAACDAQILPCGPQEEVVVFSVK